MSKILSPANIFSILIDHSVNAASVRRNCKGGVDFLTQIQSNDSGNFNGDGTGNKAIAGLSGFNNIALKDLPKPDLSIFLNRG